MKLWDKGYELDKEIENYTVQKDFELDMRLIPYDIKASLAHIQMLMENQYITEKELFSLKKGFDDLDNEFKNGTFSISPDQEDGHTAIEEYINKSCGSVGEKIHTGRSRNDQVLTALRLYMKDVMLEIEKSQNELYTSLISFAEKNRSVQMPGYTHMQRAMPTDFGVWAEAFSSAITDDLKLGSAILNVIDQNPLGSAAGFGVPLLNIDKKRTSELMGFTKVQNNPMYCQMSRGKFEGQVASYCSGILYNLNKLASDCILFSMEEFGFLKLPWEYCTGSSIMPQKKNPDVLELVRAMYHSVLGDEFKIKSLISNLISGYNRDVQLSKSPFFSIVDNTLSTIKIMNHVIKKIEIIPENCTISEELLATEQVYKLVQKGVPFREAYKRIARNYVK